MQNTTKKLLILAKSSKTVFSNNELAILWKIQDKNVLKIMVYRLIRDGFLIMLKRGLYAMPDKTINKYELACKMKKFSYISYETVLANAGVIHQWHGSTYSSGARSEKIKKPQGIFLYRHLPERILLNRLGIEKKGEFFIATPERALCDKFFKDGNFYLDNIRPINKNKIISISKIYNKQVVRLVENILD